MIFVFFFVEGGITKASCRMSVATVVGMVVSIQNNKENIEGENLEKSYLTFPDEKDILSSFQVKMLMLDGFAQ